MQKIKISQKHPSVGYAKETDAFPAPRIYSLEGTPKSAVSVRTLTQRYAQEKRGSIFGHTSALRHYVPTVAAKQVQTERAKASSQFLLIIRRKLETTSQPRVIDEQKTIRVQDLMTSPFHGVITPRPAATMPPANPERRYSALISEYKALMRRSYVGSLPPDQEQELEDIRIQIQAIGYQDKHTQEAIRQAQEMNASLDKLEAKIEAKISQRKKEQQEKDL